MTLTRTACLTIGVTVLALTLATALPPAQKQFLRAIPTIGEYLAESNVSLGLDLAGGTHLDYKINLDDVPARDHNAIVAGVRTVLERRVNGLGVAEPNIYEFQAGGEQFISVELAGVSDVDEAKRIVGRTIQLSFQEQDSSPDPERHQRVSQAAQEFAEYASQQLAANNPQAAEPDLAIAGIDQPQADFAQLLTDQRHSFARLYDFPGKLWLSELPQEYAGFARDAQPGDISEAIELPGGFAVMHLLDKQVDIQRTTDIPQMRDVRHVLIAFAGAERSDASVTRSLDQAREQAESVLARALAGEDFAELARELSDGPSASDGGDLGAAQRGTFVPAFESALFALEEPGLVDRIVRTPFGFHVIEMTGITAAKTETSIDTDVSLQGALFSTDQSRWKPTALTGQHFRTASVAVHPTTGGAMVAIAFTSVSVAEAAELSGKLIAAYLALLLGGVAAVCYGLRVLTTADNTRLRRDVVVSALGLVLAIAGGVGMQYWDPNPPAATDDPAALDEPAAISQTDQAGVDLFADITKRNLGKPVAIFLDGLPIIDGDPNQPGLQVYAPTIRAVITDGRANIEGLASIAEASELSRSLNTGAIPAPISLVGQYTIGASLGQHALGQSLRAGAAGLVLVAVAMLLYYRAMGLIASIALAVYGALLVAAISLLGVVLTLAGVAGIILSIGLAVDANILIFERIREELAAGSTTASAIETGFRRAWQSIRDSNASSLITCAILFWFGSSIIQGFALTLAVGIVISLFTAVTFSRGLLRASRRIPRVFF